jgi:hypothetical protein
LVLVAAPVRASSTSLAASPAPAETARIGAAPARAEETRPEATRAEETWVDYFEDLYRLEHMERGSPAFVDLDRKLSTVAKERERGGLKRKDSLEKCRARVVRHHLQLLHGLPAELATEPETEPVWVPHEAWFATRALVPGLFRVQAAIAAIDELRRAGAESIPQPERDQRLAWAERVAAEERALGRLELAERAATAVFAYAPGADTALRLAHVLALRGVGDEARSVLSHALDGGLGDDARMQLFLARARISSGVHDERRAISDWGAALSLGSDEAALDLGWRALLNQDRTQAAFLARAVLETAPRREDALALWALSLLPEPAGALAQGAGRVP